MNNKIKKLATIFLTVSFGLCCYGCGNEQESTGYDGKEFDISSSFESLKNTRYISDGNKEQIVIPNELDKNLIDTEKEVVTY